MSGRRSLRRARVLARRHGPTAPIWRRRAAILSGAVLLGLVALGGVLWGVRRMIRR